MKLIKTYTPNSYPRDVWFDYQWNTWMLEWSYTSNKIYRLV